MDSVGWHRPHHTPRHSSFWRTFTQVPSIAGSKAGKSLPNSGSDRRLQRRYVQSRRGKEHLLHSSQIVLAVFTVGQVILKSCHLVRGKIIQSVQSQRSLIMMNGSHCA